MLPKENKSFHSSKASFFIIILLYTGALPVLDSAWTKILRAVLFRNSNLIPPYLIATLTEFCQLLIFELNESMCKN